MYADLMLQLETGLVVLGSGLLVLLGGWVWACLSVAGGGINAKPSTCGEFMRRPWAWCWGFPPNCGTAILCLCVNASLNWGNPG